jgi:HAD superfamily hydrolase (TIGR01509 family)
LLQILENVDHVLLDFDGVLADSEPWYRRSWNRVLSDYGHRVPEEEYWLHWTNSGEGLQGEIRRQGLPIDPEAADSLRRRQRRIYSRFCREGAVPLFPGAPELLRLLTSGAAGIAGFAIASNTASELVRAVLEEAGSMVPEIVGGEGLPHKPDPAIFLAAAAEIGAKPGACLVVEDAQKGIRAARSGGFRSCLVRNDQNRALRIEADCEVPDLVSLVERLRRL